MTLKTSGTLLTVVGLVLTLSGVALLYVSSDIDGVSGFSIAACWGIVVAGLIQVASGLVLMRRSKSDH